MSTPAPLVTVTIEPIDVAIVALTPERYEELLAAEKTAKDAAAAASVPPELQFPRRFPPVFPWIPTATLEEPNPYTVRALLSKLTRLERQADRDLAMIRDLRDKLADARDRHEKATRHVGARVRKLKAMQAEIDAARADLDNIAKIEVTQPLVGPPQVTVSHGVETVHLTFERGEVQSPRSDVSAWTRFGPRPARQKFIRDASNVTLR